MEGRGRDRWREGEKIYELGMQHIRELGRVNSRSEHAVLLLSVSSTGASRPSQCWQSLSVCDRLFAAWLIRDMCSFPPKYVHSRIYAYASPPLCRSSDQSLCSLPSCYTQPLYAPTDPPSRASSPVPSHISVTAPPMYPPFHAPFLHASLPFPPIFPTSHLSNSTPAIPPHFYSPSKPLVVFPEPYLQAWQLLQWASSCRHEPRAHAQVSWWDVRVEG